MVELLVLRSKFLPQSSGFSVKITDKNWITVSCFRYSAYEDSQFNIVALFNLTVNETTLRKLRV